MTYEPYDTSDRASREAEERRLDDLPVIDPASARQLYLAWQRGLTPRDEWRECLKNPDWINGAWELELKEGRTEYRPQLGQTDDPDVWSGNCPLCWPQATARGFRLHVPTGKLYACPAGHDELEIAAGLLEGETRRMAVRHRAYRRMLEQNHRHQTEADERALEKVPTEHLRDEARRRARADGVSVETYLYGREQARLALGGKPKTPTPAKPYRPRTRTRMTFADVEHRIETGVFPPLEENENEKDA